MPINRQEKEQIVSDLAQAVKDAKGIVFADYKGLTVAEIQDLRAKLRESNAIMKVAKVSLMKKALQEAGFKMDFDSEVPTAIAYSMEDEVAPAKILAKFAKDNDKLSILSGILSGNFLSDSAVKDLAKLPGQTELRGQVVSVLVAPLRGLVTVMSGAQRNLLYALNAIAAKKA